MFVAVFDIPEQHDGGHARVNGSVDESLRWCMDLEAVEGEGRALGMTHCEPPNLRTLVAAAVSRMGAMDATEASIQQQTEQLAR